MDRKDSFLENAVSIFDAAQLAANDGGAEDTSILVGHDGSIRVVSGSTWPLASLEAHHGARMAFRVRPTASRGVRLEGRAGSRTCLFEAAKPDGAARLLLANSYRCVPTPVRRLAETAPLPPAA